MNLAKAHPVENEFGEIETNDVVIRSYTSIGTVQGYGKVEIEAREAVIPDRRHAAYFVKIGLQTADEFPQTAAALIQYDNVPKLLTSLERLEKAVIKTDRFAYSEIEYDVDGLRIIVFNDARGKIMFVISAMNVSIHFSTIASLTTLRGLIERAYKHLDCFKLDF
ncbi:hypothetical protein [Mesorhizobium sp. ZC-5]|uniref:hypothetical protein n=1 Tax=Mesorhizobium sp. ZC-5 TaxID=2986066 RepID=UPI0021E76B3F|nr:hypothetical protein [Mesorhizobium sp. ZC-5]MCV3241044.1 hypothetical protein [Mesorhizobium sp. ZC-5]